MSPELIPLVIFTAVIVILIALIFLRPRENDDLRLQLDMEALPEKGLRAVLLELAPALQKDGIYLTADSEESRGLFLKETVTEKGCMLEIGQRAYTVWLSSDLNHEHECAETLVRILNDHYAALGSRRRATLDVVKEDVFLHIRAML